MSDLDAEFARGQRAAQILNDELVVAFFADAEQELWQAWKQSPLRDAEGREKLRLMQEWLTKFRAMLETHLMTGQMARMTLQQRAEMTDRMRAEVLPRSWVDAE